MEILFQNAFVDCVLDFFFSHCIFCIPNLLFHNKILIFEWYILNFRFSKSKMEDNFEDFERR